MATGSRIESQRAFVRRAASTGAAQRARKKAGIGLSEAARGLKVSESTLYRWEHDITVPTHGENLRGFARFLQQVHADQDPEMHKGSRAAKTA